jgi:hypothetical protein
MKVILFIVLALLISFLTGAGFQFMFSALIIPLIKAYPHISGNFAFAIFLHSLPWLIDILGALLLALSGHFLLGKKMWLFLGLSFIALCTAWIAGSYASIISKVGLVTVFEFPLYFWIGFTHIGLLIFNIVPWIDGLTFISFGILVFYLLSKKLKIKTPLFTT